MSVAVEFDEVVKSFGPVRVLHGVSVALEPGRVYGLLGENGAGKSTLMKILAGYEALSGGEVRINGRAAHFSGSRAADSRRCRHRRRSRGWTRHWPWARCRQRLSVDASAGHRAGDFTGAWRGRCRHQTGEGIVGKALDVGAAAGRSGRE